MIKLTESDQSAERSELEQALLIHGDIGEQIVLRAQERPVDEAMNLMRRALTVLLEDKSQRGTLRPTTEGPVEDPVAKNDLRKQIAEMTEEQVLRFGRYRGVNLEGKDAEKVRQELLQAA